MAEGAKSMNYFELFRDNYCKHQSGFVRIMEDGEPVAGCSYKNEEPAKSWDGWQECKPENCHFFRKFKIERR